MKNDPIFLKEFQKKVEEKLKEQEIDVIQHWKTRLEKTLTLKPEGIAALQLEIKKIADMMENRLKILKKG